MITYINFSLGLQEGMEWLVKTISEKKWALVDLKFHNNNNFQLYTHT